MLTVALVGVEQGIGVAVGLAILDRIRLSARPQLHVLGRIPGTTSWTPVSTERPAPLRFRVSWPCCSPRRSGTPTRCTFAKRSAAALARSPGTRVLVLDTIGMSDVDFTGSRALGQVLDACDTPSRRVRRGPSRCPRRESCGAAGWRRASARTASSRGSMRRSPPSRRPRRPPGPGLTCREAEGPPEPSDRARYRCHPRPQRRGARHHDPAACADEGAATSIGMPDAGPPRLRFTTP